jgi:cell division septum initiation protein DivIVA
MDIQHLVDRLEELFNEGRHVMGHTFINEDRALEIIDQMRISIPTEIEKASRVMAQRDRIMAEANEEAARVIQQARQDGENLVENENTVQAARTRAQNIIAQAKVDADRIMADADQYVLQSLTRLEGELLKKLNEVRNGITLLHTEQPVHSEAQAEVPSVYEKRSPVSQPEMVVQVKDAKTR